MEGFMGQRLDEFSDLLLQMYRLSAEQALE